MPCVTVSGRTKEDVLRSSPGFSRISALRWLFVAVACFAGSMACAAESGRITLTLATERLELPMKPGHSDWTGSRGFAKVSILTRPTDVATWERFQSLRLAFDLLRTGAQAPEISLLRRGEDTGFERWYGRSERGGLAVAVTNRAFDGTALTVSGSFSGMLGRSLDFGQTIDLSTPMPVSGTFEVTLLPIR